MCYLESNLLYKHHLSAQYIEKLTSAKGVLATTLQLKSTDID